MSRHRAAMSLLELTIVMLVLAVTAAVTAPRFSTAVRRSQSHAAAIHVASHINYVRRIAMNEGRVTSLTFLPAVDRYSSGDVDFPDRVGQLLEVDLRETFDSGLDLTCDLDGGTWVTFDLEGIPHVGAQWLQDGTITISLGASTYNVMIASGTGIATVVDANDSGGN